MDDEEQEENGQQNVEDANSCSDNVEENNMQSLTQNKSSTILIDEDVLDPLMNLSNHASIHISRHRSSRNFCALSTPLRQKTFVDEQSKEIHNMNKEQLKAVLSSTLKQAQGVEAIEVWVLNKHRTHLTRPEGGWYRNESYKVPNDLNEKTVMTAFEMLEDTERDDYMEPKPTQPGQGLVGRLFSTSDLDGKEDNGISDFGSYHGGKKQKRRLSRSMSLSISGKLRGLFPSNDNSEENVLNYVSLDYLAKDPDQISSQRIHGLLAAGIDKACSALFQIRGYKGLVIFYSSSRTERRDLLSNHNSNFLAASADMIGATFALVEPRTTQYFQKNREEQMSNSQDIGNSQTPKDIENGIKDINMKAIESRDNEEQRCKNLWAMVYDKSFGTKNATPPKAMPLSESVWSLIGSFITLMIVSAIAETIRFWKGDELYFVLPMAPFGALICLQYGLTAAPASQPRNCIYGTAIAGTIGLLLAYAERVPTYIRICISASSAIAAMTKLAVVHPPAGAVAVIFASGDFHFGHLLLSLLANTIAIMTAMLINNMNEKRQYPQYWNWF